MTAFRIDCPLKENRQRNFALRRDLAAEDLSYYPVIGSGQEAKRFFLAFKLIVPSSEESFVVQPRTDSDQDGFRANLRKLLDKYDQDFAAMKLQGDPMAFLLFRDGRQAPLGNSAAPRRPNDAFYSELLKGPRTPANQRSAWEAKGERSPLIRIANWLRGRGDLNQATPSDRRGGRRFVIRSRYAPEGGRYV